MSVIDVAPPLITFVALSAVGMDLTPADFRHVRRQPAVVLAGLLAPVVVLPLLAVALLAALSPRSDIAAGLLLVAACPIGGPSNTFSYLARASTALSVVLTALSSMAAVVTIPLISWGFTFALERPLQFSAPAMLPVQLLVLVLGPVVAGMCVRHRWPAAAEEWRGAIQRLALASLVLLLVIIITSDLLGFLSGLTETVPVAVLFIAGSFAAGSMVGAAIGCTAPDRFTLAAEFATRHVAVATTIAVTVLGQPSFAVFAATYFLTEAPLLLLAVLWYRAGQGARVLV